MLTVFLLTMVLLLLFIVSPPTRRATYSFWCPFTEGNVTADFDEEVWGNRRVRVDSCSAFSPPTKITCDMNCRWLRKFPRPKAFQGR